MTVLTSGRLTAAGIDAVALKPSEVSVERAHELGVGTLTIDYEGREHVPTPETFEKLAAGFDVRATVPVRADGFDPLGDQHLRSSLPSGVGEVLVAGNPAYLSDEENNRAVAPRLDAAMDAATDPWVGTEGIERIALAAGGTQFELLSGSTKRDVHSLRAAGFDGKIAVYAPTVLTDDEDAILDAVGGYAARRQRVRAALPQDVPTDSTVGGETRDTLVSACREYALAGSVDTVSQRVEDLSAVGVDQVVSYPARGLDAVRS